LTTTGGATHATCEDRDDQADENEANGENRPGGREDGSRDSDAHRSDRECDEGRHQAAQIEALERVDVSDHPPEQLAAAIPLELRGRKGLDALEEACADSPQGAESVVVGDETLEVAGKRPRESEEAHCDDRHGQGEDWGLLRGA
jgi:hypothetical protein